MKNRAFEFLAGAEVATTPRADCLGSKPALANQLVSRGEIAALTADAAGRLALEGGNFTVDPTVAVPKASLVEQRLVEMGGSHLGTFFGTWEDTTQEPPVVTPAQLRANTKPRRLVGLLARATRSGEVTIKSLE